MKTLFETSQQYIPSGVNSPVRAFKSVDANPIFIDKADGAYVYDNQGKSYIDFVASWGVMILGHNHPSVRQKLAQALQNGTSFGASTELEVEWAKKVCELIPSIEKIRMVNSGTEATMSAIRLARGYTHKNKIIKFKGCYHGHGDSFLIEAGSGALTHNQPSSPGVTKGTAQDTLLADFNNFDSVEKCFTQYPSDIAAIIIEPVVGNMGTIPATQEFLKSLRDICDKYNSLLVFDEVMTGFRLSLQGAQGLYGIKPDLTTLGKIVGGGLPVGAYGGKADIMDELSPQGPVYQAGTLSGNPLATTAGIEVFKHLSQPDFYQTLETKSAIWEQGLKEVLDSLELKLTLNRIGSMMTLFFTESKVNSYQEALSCNTHAFSAWFRGMLEQGIYLAPSQFEAGFLSIAHTKSHLNKTQEAAHQVLSTMYCKR